MLRDYLLDDYSACLTILNSNFPRFFSFQDCIDFLAFLDAPDGKYSILEDQHGSIIGCGGIALQNEHTGILKWGMIHLDFHRQGWGSTLTISRLSQLSNISSVKKIILHTSHESVDFYKKMGFQVVTFIPNFYRQGLHRYDMGLYVDENFQYRLADTEAGSLYRKHHHQQK